MEQEHKRTTLLAKISGCTWDKDDEPVMIDTEDQCRGIIQFTIDDDAVHSRMYGDVTVGDLGSVMHMLRQIFGSEGMEMANAVADGIGKLAEQAGA